MITEWFFNMFRSLFEVILGLLPVIDITIPTGFMTWFTDILSASAYFLPLIDFVIMLGIFVAVTNFEIIWKTIQRIWDALPFT